MRKKTENLDIIVDKKTVRITTAVFVTVMTILAAIAAMFFTTMFVLAADAGSSSNSQSTISTTVPDSHNIRVEKSHADVVIEGEEDQTEGNIDNFVVDRFAEAKREDCSKKSTVLKAHKYSTFGKILSIRKTQDVGISRPICC